ncbi:hypothetical protein ORIO_08605 [Cereibacter azotoformans]|uniref:hypothetical protein n=1 Tax=Cereibacter azotoformans TaxID=43057 RepID=UPI0012666F7F|nr:hypothetical protein [Cereibacter azotoformans]ULB09965.1 hypothetical protein ORIO_08605 [Cereibacter azotoformans]
MFTTNEIGDTPTLVGLQDQISHDEDIGRITAEAAIDRRKYGGWRNQRACPAWMRKRKRRRRSTAQLG